MEYFCKYIRVMKVKEESEKVGLKLNIQKMKIMASGPITACQIDGKQWKQCQTLFWGGSKITGSSLVAQTVKRLPTMWETQVRPLGQEDPLKKEMATHSSTLAWKIPWMEKHGGLQSMGSQRVGHD